MGPVIRSRAGLAGEQSPTITFPTTGSPANGFMGNHDDSSPAGHEVPGCIESYTPTLAISPGNTGVHGLCRKKGVLVFPMRWALSHAQVKGLDGGS